jgi:hypothetical protein
MYPRGCTKDCVNAVLSKTRIGEPNDDKKRLDRRIDRNQRGKPDRPDGLVMELTKALVERMLAGELNHHLGYESTM